MNAYGGEDTPELVIIAFLLPSVIYSIVGGQICRGDAHARRNGTDSLAPLFVRQLKGENIARRESECRNCLPIGHGLLRVGNDRRELEWHGGCTESSVGNSDSRKVGGPLTILVRALGLSVCTFESAWVRCYLR